ncbi:MAG: hypothetical protein HC853_00750 [Anaerolineae bacterium]|nr:hypothetical protein [Anaerolineae bacterium]
MAELEEEATSPKLGAAIPAATERKTLPPLKLELSQKQAAFEDNHRVVTLTFAPNKVNPADQQIMLALQIAGDVVALQSFKQSTFGPLPEPVETLLSQSRGEWPKRYADAVQAQQATQAKTAALAASTKAKTAKTKVQPKDIKAPPPPTPLFGSTTDEVRQPDAQEEPPKIMPAKPNTVTLFDLEN